MSDQLKWNPYAQQSHSGLGNGCGHSSQPSRRCRKRHWVRNILAGTGAVIVALGSLAMAGAEPAAGAVGVRLAADLQPAAPGASPVIDGPACPDVMVIAARGSGEAPTTDWQEPSAYTSDPNHGAGATLYTMYGELANADKNLTFSLDPVVYRADSISVLFTNTLRYLSDPGMGAAQIVLDIEATDDVCGHTVRYILAGYSLGAWAVHDALQELSAAQLGEIAGVAFFGDPEFASGQAIVRDFQSQDIYDGIAYIADPKDNSIPSVLIPQTGSWCLPADPVCQVQTNHLATWLDEVELCIHLSAACAHFQYPYDGETLKAATFLSPFLPTTTLWPQLTNTPPNGTVGSPYTWTAAAVPTGTYLWTSTGTVPPGLSFSPTGVLSGMPSQAGTFTFSITATGGYGRFVTGQVSVTIDPSAASGSGSAYVALGDNGTVTPISLATGTAGTAIAVGSYPSGIVITPDGTTAYVANGGTALNNGKVTPINLATGIAGTPIPVGNGPLGIAITPNGATVYVTDWEDGTVTAINTATNTAGTPIPVGNSPYEIAVTPDGATAYVANCGSDTVTAISTATNTAGTPIPVGDCPEGIAITPDGTTAYVTNSTDGTVTPIDLATGTAGTSITVGNGPRGIAITSDGAWAYVTNETDGTVTPIDLATNTPGTPIQLGSNSEPYGIAITPGST